jgi:hypothetical protein
MLSFSPFIFPGSPFSFAIAVNNKVTASDKSDISFKSA